MGGHFVGLAASFSPFRVKKGSRATVLERFGTGGASDEGKRTGAAKRAVGHGEQRIFQLLHSAVVVIEEEEEERKTQSFFPTCSS